MHMQAVWPRVGCDGQSSEGMPPVQVIQLAGRKEAGMNDKLAAFAGKQIISSVSGWRKGGVARAELVGVTKNDEKKEAWSVRISLHSRAVQMLGWQTGDRIRIDVGQSGCLVLSRDNNVGRKLCMSTGKAKRRYVRFRVTKEFYDALPVGIGTNIEIDHGCISFDV